MITNRGAVSPMIIVGVLIFVSVVGIGAYYFQSKSQLSVKPELVEKMVEKQLFSENLKRLDQDLKLFKFTEDDKANGLENSFTYYSAGNFNQGALQGYTRIVAVRPPDGPGDPYIFLLATRDFQSFVLNDVDGKTTKYPEDDWENPYRILDKSKITSTKIFDSEQPKQINLDKNYSLYFQSYLTDYLPTKKVDSYGNKVEDLVLVDNLSTYQKLDSPVNNLTFYYKPREISNYFDQLDEKAKESEKEKQKYIVSSTEVIVVDSVGLPAIYSLTSPANIKTYQQKIVEYGVAIKNYQEQIKKYDKKEISEYPQSPEYVYLPNLSFESEIIENKNNLKFYKSYSVAIPEACASSLDSKIINVSDSDLESVGSVSNNPLYRLKDTNHPLYELAFRNKMDYYDLDSTAWDQINKTIKKPILEGYIKNNPLLFIKDYWGRWVAFGEYDIMLPGGCGKPVIYLYPERTTKVSVKFDAPVQFTVDIPKYNDSWQVLAHRDGSLENLKQNAVDCQKIDYSKKGSEYAKEACQKNSYPYLYWAGNISSIDYPKTNNGWIVEKENINNFLENKLSEIGLNKNEKEDFIGYWLPDMMAKNAPYYRISFLQTPQINNLFPMTIDPRPNTIFRIFLDYLPISDMPKKIPEPQTLNKLVRNGFTVVEWGGLKRY